MFVVFDLDGTLSDDRHRHHLLPPREHGLWDVPGEYSAYHAACADDPPIIPTLKTFIAHAVAGHRVEIWTGRNATEKTKTRRWLSHCMRGCGYFGLASDIKMRMRTEEGSAVEMKRRWLLALPPQARPRLAYDDRADVAAMFREHGVACFQVAAL